MAALTFYVYVGRKCGAWAPRLVVLFDSADKRLDSASVEDHQLWPLNVSFPATAVAGQKKSRWKGPGSVPAMLSVMDTLSVGGIGQDRN